MKKTLFISFILIVNFSFAINFEYNDSISNTNNSHFIYPEQFGANGNDQIDDTESIQKAIDFCVKNKVDLIFTDGNYIMNLTSRKLSTSSKKKLAYSVIIKDASGFSIICTKNATLRYDFSAKEKYNLFGVYNSSKLKFLDLNCYGGETIRPYTFGDGLYQGAGVFIQNSNQITVKGGEFHNMFYAVDAHKSDNIIIENNIFKVDKKIIEDAKSNSNNDPSRGRYSSPQIPLSAFILYSTSNSVINNNIIYGGLRDGDLSVFGSGSERNTITNNKMYSYPFDDLNKEIIFQGQGITIDQGPRYTEVSQNHLVGYYYGIDIKADSHYANVHDNHIRGCVAAIIERKGESPLARYTVGNVIHHNSILLSDEVLDKKGRAFGGKYFVVGIQSYLRYGTNITNNTIRIYNKPNENKQFKKDSKPICGIHVIGLKSLTNQVYLNPFIIKDNIIDFTFGLDATTSIAPKGSVGMHLQRLHSGIISSNSINLLVSAFNRWKSFLFLGQSKDLLFSNNYIYSKPVKSDANIYFGDIYIKGKLNSGQIKSSNFIGNWSSGRSWRDSKRMIDSNFFGNTNTPNNKNPH